MIRVANSVLASDSPLELHQVYPLVRKNKLFIKNEAYQPNLKSITPMRFWKWFEERDFINQTFELINQGNSNQIKKGKFKNKSNLVLFGRQTIYSDQFAVLKYPLKLGQGNHNQISRYDLLSHNVNCTLILHSSIVNYIGGLHLGTVTSQDPNQLGIIMEVMDSNLKILIESDIRLKDFVNQIKIAKQIARGMAFLHSLNPYILHKNLNSSNILINKNLECKISNFRINSENQSFTIQNDINDFGFILFELFLNRTFSSNDFETMKNLLETSNINISLKKSIFECIDSNTKTSFEVIYAQLSKFLEEEDLNLELIAQSKISLPSSKKEKSDIFSKRDILGRNLIHYYCIYGNVEGLKEAVSNNGKECLEVVDKFNLNCSHFAARNGHLSILKYLHENNFSKFNERETRFEMNSLGLALSMKHNSCVEFLSSLANQESLNRALIFCSQQGNLELVKFFLQKGASISYYDSEVPYTSLGWAICGGHFELVQFLIEKGANTEQGRIDCGATALLVASQIGDIEIVKYLLSHSKSNINSATSSDGITPLFVAVQGDFREIVELLLEHGADPNKPCTELGSNCLYAAIEADNFYMVQLLVNKSANVNQSVASDGSTPLFMAAAEGNVNIISFLLEKGANVNNKRNTDGVTALFMSCQKGKKEAVNLLLENGAYVNQSTIDTETSPLFIASQNGFTQIVELLLDKGADVNKKRKTDGKTPLYIAAQNGQKEIVHRLLKQGNVLVNEKIHKDGSTPLFIASVNGYYDIVNLLLDYGADPNIVLESNGSSPLFIACMKGFENIAEILLKKGANPNLVFTEDGYTCLFVCSQNGDTQTVKLLLEQGADPNKGLLFNDCSPLYIATQCGHSSIVNMLLSKGANIDSIFNEDPQFLLETKSDNSNQEPIDLAKHYQLTPLYIAWWLQQEELISLLIKEKSNIQLNIQLAKQNQHSAALKYFEAIQNKF